MHEAETSPGQYRDILSEPSALIFKYMLLRRLVDLLPAEAAQLDAWAVVLRGAIQRAAGPEDRCEVGPQIGHLGHLCDIMCTDGCFLSAPLQG